MQTLVEARKVRVAGINNGTVQDYCRSFRNTGSLFVKIAFLVRGSCRPMTAVISHDHAVAKWRDSQACVRVIDENNHLYTFQFLATKESSDSSHHRPPTHHHRHRHLPLVLIPPHRIFERLLKIISDKK